MTSKMNRKMRRVVCMSAALGAVLLMSVISTAQASEATTSASVTQLGGLPGTATATAAYNGSGVGQARTHTRSGQVSFGQGVAFGVSPEGISFSASYAVGGRFLPATASTFNLSIGRDGSVAGSNGLVVASPAPLNSASAGGFARSQFGGSVAGATVGGRSNPFGQVIGRTNSYSTPPRRLWR